MFEQSTFSQDLDYKLLCEMGPWSPFFYFLCDMVYMHTTHKHMLFKADP